MLLKTKEIAQREAEMVSEITGIDVSHYFLACVSEDAENANKSIASYVPNVGYNVEYFDLEGIESYIKNAADVYIRTWYEHKKKLEKTVYCVRYENQNGCDDSTETYNTEEEAEAVITEELEAIKESLSNACLYYDYCDYARDDGMTAEIYLPGQDYYARWVRLWKC